MSECIFNVFLSMTQWYKLEFSKVGVRMYLLIWSFLIPINHRRIYGHFTKGEHYSANNSRLILTQDGIRSRIYSLRRVRSHSNGGYPWTSWLFDLERSRSHNKKLTILSNSYMCTFDGFKNICTIKLIVISHSSPSRFKCFLENTTNVWLQILLSSQCFWINK